MIASRYRLLSSAFERPDDAHSEEPKRIIILSVEGTRTEKDYFSRLNRHLDNSVVHVEVLSRRRSEGSSDPNQVLGLLEEYINLRGHGIIPAAIRPALVSKYSEIIIKEYESGAGTLSDSDREQISRDLEVQGIDIEYRRHLRELQAEGDHLGIVIDRDRMSHSRELMKRCADTCADMGYGCYISNPCFEFWLLLHLCDVSKEFDEDKKRLLLENKRVSNRHTFVSKEVSERTEHTKKISQKVFDSFYFKNIQVAMERAKDFSTKCPELLDGLGTNIPDLLEEIGVPLA